MLTTAISPVLARLVFFKCRLREVKRDCLVADGWWSLVCFTAFIPLLVYVPCGVSKVPNCDAPASNRADSIGTLAVANTLVENTCAIWE